MAFEITYLLPYIEGFIEEEGEPYGSAEFQRIPSLPWLATAKTSI